MHLPNAVVNLLAREWAESAFSQLAYLSYHFAFRAPSEMLAIRRASCEDSLTEFSPPTGQSLDSNSQTSGPRDASAKIPFVGTLWGRCVLFRPRLCSGKDTRDRTLCPAHVVWPTIRDRAAAGRPISPTISRRVRPIGPSNCNGRDRIPRRAEILAPRL